MSANSVDGKAYKVAIVGAGPSGLSAAVRAAHYGDRCSYILLEASDRVANTVRKYQKGKHVMANPPLIPLREGLPFEAGRREEILKGWETTSARSSLNVRYNAKLVGVTREHGFFSLIFEKGDRVSAENVVLAIGVQGSPKGLGERGKFLDGEGEDKGIVQYQLDDPDAYDGETIVICCGGDVGVENALALAENEDNRVIILNGYPDFDPKMQEANRELVDEAIEHEKIVYESKVKIDSFERIPTLGKCITINIREPTKKKIGCDRVIIRNGAFPPSQLLDEIATSTGNSPEGTNGGNVYRIGSCTGEGNKSLIKSCINDGYDVIERIVNPNQRLTPVDEDFIKKKDGANLREFLERHGLSTVEAGLELIRANVPLFAELEVPELRALISESKVRYLNRGGVVFRQGEYTDTFFSILEGELEFASAPGATNRNVRLGKGDYFGEIGLLSGRPRSGTVKALGKCVVLETGRRKMRDLLNRNPRIEEALNSAWLRRTLRSMFGPWVSPPDIERLQTTAALQSFDTGWTLFEEGEAPKGVFLIRDGSVVVSRNYPDGRQAILSYIAAGNVVGEGALVNSTMHSTTARAAIRSTIFFVAAEEFETLLARNLDLRTHLDANLRALLINQPAREAVGERAKVFNSLLGQGIGESTDVLLIDESLCIRCDNCEKACADTHDGISRLDREAGPTYANLHVPTSCRHCEHPHCMKDCPPDAIRRRSTGEVEILDTCIGCGNCERNCPYDVIQMGKVQNALEKRMPRWLSRPSLYAWMLSGFATEPGCEQQKPNDLRTGKVADDVRKVAVKCDLCKEQVGGPACVRACPTGAAIRVSPEELLDSPMS